MMAKKLNSLLILRGDIWYYQRRVPKKFRHIEARLLVRHSLNTDSLQIARRRRDALVEADDLYWSTLSQEAVEKGGVSETTRLVQQQLYKGFSALALNIPVCRVNAKARSPKTPKSRDKVNCSVGSPASPLTG